MLDSVIESKKKYYPQTLLEECKYEQERIKIENLIDYDLEKSESDEPDSATESDNDNHEQFVKKLKKYFNNNNDNNKSLRPSDWLCLIVCVNHALLGFYLCQSI